MTDILFEEITELDKIEYFYRQALKGKTKYTQDAILFSLNETYNLVKLQKELREETYEPSDFIEFKVYEPKERIIHAPHFKDKIVQLMIYKTLSEKYNKTFIKDSYASIENKGTHKCLSQIQHYLRKAKWEYGDGAYIIKIDMKKFFYSIDREILKDRIDRTMEDGKMKRLVFKVIDSADKIDKKGLPLGNTSSQVLANIYMDKLDKYCKCKLSIKYYCRYMDDIFIVVRDKDTARHTLKLIKQYTKEKLHLECNKKKTKIFPLAQGVNMVGFKIQTTHKLLRSESKNNMKRKIKKLEKLYEDGKLGKMKVEQILNSWVGHARKGDCYNMINSIVASTNIFAFDGRKIYVKGVD